MHDPREPFPRVQVPEDVARALTYFATMAADHEALKPRPVSSVRGPRGEEQGETPHEYTRRITEAAVLHLVEIGLLAVPKNFDARCDDFLPLWRDDGAWKEPRPQD